MQTFFSTLNKRLSLACAAFVLLSGSGATSLAQARDRLPETVLMIPKHVGAITTQLETTIYRPDGPGPFPVVIFNHGKIPGYARLQPRAQPINAARYFVARGYAVVVPMRQGFSKSTGPYQMFGCDVERNGRGQAEDVTATLDYVVAQPWADPSRMLVAGQSHGGWTTLAFGATRYPGVKGLINFMGGLLQTQCTWSENLIRGAGVYGSQSVLPSLWFYGANDSFFPLPTSGSMFEHYVAAGGKARMVAVGTFDLDSHTLLRLASGAPIWQPEVTKFLREVGLPSEPVPADLRYAAAPLTPVPAPPYARLDQPEKLPVQTAAALLQWRLFLTKASPRAFAVSPTGGVGYAWDYDDPRDTALANCKRVSPVGCKLYAVDNDVVWQKAP